LLTFRSKVIFYFKNASSLSPIAKMWTRNTGNQSADLFHNKPIVPTELRCPKCPTFLPQKATKSLANVAVNLINIKKNITQDFP
jgi:hypothetical protein